MSAAEIDFAERQIAISDLEARAQDAEDSGRDDRAAQLRSRARALLQETVALYGAGGAL